MGRERFPLLPDVPTLREAGYDQEMVGWSGLFGPANLPKDIVQKLELALVEVGRDPVYADRLLSAGAALAKGGSEELGAQLAADLKLYKEISQSAKIGEGD
jgi:tripartite-type tricarboxylate transporter receptor subunit TctC